jgi:lysylphosphatidylglycerol synthetase-like protein (DUF2156 family)
VPPEARDQSLALALQEVSSEWLSYKKLPELKFAVGGPDAALESSVRLGVARDSQGRIQGFVVWVPVPAKNGWMLEVVRRKASMQRLSGYMVAESLLAFQKESVQYASLSGTPLARAPERWNPGLRLAAAGVARIARGLYDCQGIYRFKRKFNPSWQELYLACPSKASLLPSLVAAARACGYPTRPWQMARLAASLL